jgi:Arc/MetJ-type ribon-helix-helix transcriptional regulator
MMKTLTVRLPEEVITEIEQESRSRRVSKSDIVRERLIGKRRPAHAGSVREVIGDLIGSVEGLPPNLSRNKKRYLAEAVRRKKAHLR